MNFNAKLIDNITNFKRPKRITSSGRVNRFDGNVIYCNPFPAPIGSLCLVKDQIGKEILAEVISFDQNHNMLAILEPSSHIVTGCEVSLHDDGRYIDIDNTLLGRVTDAFGNPLDDKPIEKINNKWPLMGKVMNPLKRNLIQKPLDVGVRAINGLLTVGQGQRLGIIAGSGVGKSVLLGMMSKYTEADVVVIGLIGERGREVREFIANSLGNQGLEKSIVVASPANESPVLRLRATLLAHLIAEYWRDQGKNVLLLCDSITRVAHAQREIGLAVGEPPTSKGYPPSVFALLPRLIERAGVGKKGYGSITAIYTVLAEGDDRSDPIVDIARASLDGQVMLSRKLADAAMYPAIDLEGSVSRVADQIVSHDWVKRANRFRRLWTLYQQNKDLIQIGAYEPGSNPEIDEAIQKRSALESFMSQHSDERVTVEETGKMLARIM